MAFATVRKWIVIIVVVVIFSQARVYVHHRRVTSIKKIESNINSRGNAVPMLPDVDVESIHQQRTVHSHMRNVVHTTNVLDYNETETSAFDLDALTVDYETCVSSLPPNRSKMIKILHWLHIPKCGTSLGTVVHGYLCQELPSTRKHKFSFRHRFSECDYCALRDMNAQGTPFWDGKIRELLPNPEERIYCDWNVKIKL